MDRRLFGTDGIRGPAGTGALSPPSLARLGTAVARVFRDRGGGGTPRALIGRDTRISGPFVQCALTSGLLAGGVETHDGGVLPTPGVALLVRRRGYDLGAMVSASHNPWPDNGVKLLGPDGRKLDDATELAVEAAYFADDGVADPGATAAPFARGGADAEYSRLLAASFRGLRLRGLHVVIDPGNGAQSAIAAGMLRGLGARVTAVCCNPDGRNINEHCGAMHPGKVGREVRRVGAQLGVAFDGDADRLQLVDERGRLLDGDAILAALSVRMLGRGRLKGRTVVGTLMTNGALEVFLAGHGITLLRTPVGDRHIVQAMADHGYRLGGEPSGHVIVERGGLLTGDGLYAAVAWMAAMREDRLPASELAYGYRPWPLSIVSVKTRARPPIEDLPATSAAIVAAQELLGHGGRIVVRYSGTEPKLRVMVEARGRKLLQSALDPVVEAVRREVGA